MWTPEYFVRYAEFPRTIEAVTLPNDDGTFDIYINSLLPECVQKVKLEHEIRHIARDHFYAEKPVAECEAEANGKRSVPKPIPDIFSEAPADTIPIFNTLDIFKAYMFTMQEQRQKEVMTARKATEAQIPKRLAI